MGEYTAVYQRTENFIRTDIKGNGTDKSTDGT